MTVVLVALAVVRVWWLLGRDTITQVLRDELPDEVVEWMECPWCSGFWITVILVLVVWAVGVLPLDSPAMYVVHVLGISTVVGVVGDR